MSDNTKKAQCIHCFYFFSKDSNSTLKNHISHLHCEALKRVSESGQSSMSRDGSIFVYNPDVLREQFAELLIMSISTNLEFFDDSYAAKAKKWFNDSLEGLYNIYYAKYGNPITESSSMTSLSRASGGNQMSRLLNRLQEHTKKKARNDPSLSSEYERYVNLNFVTLLDNSAFATFDLLGFWKAKESMFLVLSRMTMDIISVQATSVASESALSNKWEGVVNPKNKTHSGIFRDVYAFKGSLGRSRARGVLGTAPCVLHSAFSTMANRDPTWHMDTGASSDLNSHTIKDFFTRHILFRCDSSGNIYPVTSPSLTPHALLSVSPSTWHQRLEHPGEDVLHSLMSRQFISCNKEKSSHLCHACQLGKHTKHIEIDIYFVRDMVARGQVRVLHVLSRYQYADIFTKGLLSTLFKEFQPDSTMLSIKLHYGGVFTISPNRKYNNGNINFVDLNSDQFSVYEIDSMLEDLGQNGHRVMFYHFLKPGCDLDNELEPLACDKDVVLLGITPVAKKLVLDVNNKQTSGKDLDGKSSGKDLEVQSSAVGNDGSSQVPSQFVNDFYSSYDPNEELKDPNFDPFADLDLILPTYRNKEGNTSEKFYLVDTTNNVEIEGDEERQSEEERQNEEEAEVEDEINSEDSDYLVDEDNNVDDVDVDMEDFKYNINEEVKFVGCRDKEQEPNIEEGDAEEI
nr:ribonuclease H-like domain-containing protein [Tanacetum cinerariifolium]